MKRHPLTIDAWRIALNQLADEYDAYRPLYPSTVLEDVVVLTGLPDAGKILEVGCGTGQLTTNFAKRGYQVQAVEPGDALAAHARRNCEQFPNVRIHVSKFEDWDAGEEKFDLVLSAQSFHLLSHDARFEASAGLLADGGSLAIVWNYRYPGNSPAHIAMHEAYENYAPEIATDQAPQDTPFEDEINASALFGTVYMAKYKWTHAYTADEYVGLLSSHASHTSLADDDRTALFTSVADGIDRNGGLLHLDYVTRLYVARRV